MPRLSRNATRLAAATVLTTALFAAAPLSAHAAAPVAAQAGAAGPVALTTAELDEVAGGRGGFYRLLRSWVRQSNSAVVNQNTIVFAPALAFSISINGNATSFAITNAWATVLANINQSNSNGG